MKYWKTYYITCFIFVLIPLTLYGQENVEQLQKLDKLMFSGRYFESKELYENLSETTTIPSDLELYYKFRMAQFLNKTDSVAYYLEQFIRLATRWYTLSVRTSISVWRRRRRR